MLGKNEYLHDPESARMYPKIYMVCSGTPITGGKKIVGHCSKTVTNLEH